LFGSVVNTGNAKGQQLGGGSGDDLNVGDSLGRCPQFRAGDMVVIVENGDVAIAEIAVGSSSMPSFM
jgi:hypothetical protein